MNDFDRDPDLPGFIISSGHDYIAQIKARGGTIVDGSRLQSLGEADCLLTDRYTGKRAPDHVIERWVRVYTARRREAEAERARKRARQRVRWEGVLTGAIDPPSILTDGYSIAHIRSEETLQKQKTAQELSSKQASERDESPPLPVSPKITRPRRPRTYNHPITSAVRPDDAITVNDAAQLANVSAGTIRMQIVRGNYKAYKVGSHIWISQAEYDRFREKRSPESRLLDAVDAVA